MKKTPLAFDFKTKHAGISALITIVVLIALIIVNILAGELSLQADLTPRKLFSLTDETLDLIGSLEEPIEIIALYEPGTEPTNIMEAANEYERHSEMISISVLDPDRNPALVAKYSKDDTPVPRGSFIVTGSRDFRVIPGMDLYDLSYGPQGQPQVMGQKVEQQITTAIAFVSTGLSPAIYQIGGHREPTLEELGLADLLTKSNYTVNEISLVRTGIPDDAALVTLIGPRSDLSIEEADMLNAYLEEGGSLLLALDLSSEPFENLYNLLRKWDIQVRRGLVFETRPNRLIAQFGDNPLVFAPYAGESEVIARLIEDKMDPIFQASLGFAPTDSRQRQLEYEALLYSSPDSFLRTDLQSEVSGSPNPIPGDESGPVDVAITVRQRNLDNYEYDGATIVALGSAGTLSGQIKANVDLFTTLVNFAGGDEASVTVPSKSMYRLPLRMGNLTGVFYAGLTIVLIPLACIIAAIVVYYRRRHR